MNANGQQPLKVTGRSARVESHARQLWPTGRCVDYVDEVPPLMDSDVLCDIVSGRAEIDPKAVMFRIVFTKSREWAHEKEWRVFSGTGRNPDATFEDIKFDAEELDAIIVGCRMPEQDRAEFADLARRKYPNALVQEAVRQTDRFGLEIRTVGQH